MDLALDFVAAAALAFAMVSRRAADDLGVCCSVGRGLGARVAVDALRGNVVSPLGSTCEECSIVSVIGGALLDGLAASFGGEDIFMEDLPNGFASRVLEALVGLDGRTFDGVVSLGRFDLF